MIDIKEYAPRSVEMKLRGPIETSDIEKLESLLDPYLPDEGAVSAVIDFSDTDDGVDPNLVKDPSTLERLLGQFDKFARIAVVTKGRAAEGIMRAVGALMPAGSLQQFDPEDGLVRARAFAAHTQSVNVHPAE